MDQATVIEQKSEEHRVEIADASLSPTAGSENEEPVVTGKTWVVIAILSMGYGLSFWPVPIFAAVQAGMATELGDPSDYVWYIPAWSLALTVSFMLAGANTDLLGRRWFLVGGNVVCFIGHLIVGTAKSNTAVIAGSAVTGFGAASCQMAAFALSELIPNKWRHLGIVFADLATLIAVIVGPVTARYGFYEGDWRWNFYSAAIFQALSFVGLYLFYHPPKHPNGLPYAQAFKELDYVGMLLFIAGATPFLMGIIYTTFLPSDDMHVVAPFIVGAVFLVLFALWEHFGEKVGWVKHPLTPTRVFIAGKGRDLTAPCVAVAVINMFYYSTSILYPTMINVFWGGESDWRYASLLSIVQGWAIAAGVMFLSAFGSRLRHWNWQLTGYCTVMVTFGVLLALGNPERKAMMIVFVFICQAGYSAGMYLSIAVSQMGVEQKDLGLSGGLSGSIRFAGGAIATAIFTAILNNTVEDQTAKLVPEAAMAAGLPASRVPELLASMASPDFAKMFSAKVVEAVGGASTQAYIKGIQVTALSSLAFGAVGIVACAFCKDIDPKMNNKIEIYMENTEYADRNKYH